jgi:hypothetical protein
MKIRLAVVLTILGLLGSAYAWDVNRRDVVHESIDHEMHAGNIELTLQGINLELKMYRAIEERRELTPDEKDRKEYLEELRLILVAEQKKQVA